MSNILRSRRQCAALSFIILVFSLSLSSNQVLACSKKHKAQHPSAMSDANASADPVLGARSNPPTPAAMSPPAPGDAAPAAAAAAAASPLSSAVPPAPGSGGSKSSMDPSALPPASDVSAYGDHTAAQGGKGGAGGSDPFSRAPYSPPPSMPGPPSGSTNSATPDMSGLGAYPPLATASSGPGATEAAAAAGAGPAAMPGVSSAPSSDVAANGATTPTAAGPSQGAANAKSSPQLSTPAKEEEDAGEDIEAATFPEDGTDPVRKPTGPSFNNSLHVPVDQMSCRGSQKLQLDRALTELAGMAELGLKSLLDTPLAPINQRYWGPADEADLSIPVGLLTRLSGGNKTNIIIRCDGNKTLCDKDKTARAEGGYVSAISGSGSSTSLMGLMKPNVTNNVMLCPDSFSGGNSARRWIEEICLDEWTLSSNSPTLFWPASLLSLLLQVPTLSSPLMQTPVHAYANVLELARRDPLAGTHSVYTYLYFLLDVFAQKHIKGGCTGQVSGRVKESKR